MPSTIKLTGVVTDVFPIENFSNFSKRAFWVKEPDTERYPQHWELELHGQDADRLKGVAIGDQVVCEVEIRGRKYNKRNGGGEGIMNSLKCVGLAVTKKMPSAPGYVEKLKPGREPDSARPNSAPEINF